MLLHQDYKELLVLLNNNKVEFLVIRIFALSGLAASLIFFLIGRKNSKLINNLLSEKEQKQANKLIKQRSKPVILFINPIPPLSEIISLMAGISKPSLGTMTNASLADLSPPLLIYAEDFKTEF